MSSHIQQVSLDELRSYLASHRADSFEGNPCLCAVLHHTTEPTAREYKGQSTWEAIRTYHINTRGWRDIAYHLGVAPDGTFWLLRPVTMTGGSMKDTALLGGRAMNKIAMAVAMIGDFDTEDPELCLPGAIQVLAAVCKNWKFSEAQVYFHRDFQSTDCPGSKISRDGVRKRIAAAIKGQEDDPGHRPADVSPWAQAAVEEAKALGLMSGYSDGTFRGNQPATREELAAVAVALHKLLRAGGTGSGG